jgi:hypothetical protein
MAQKKGNLKVAGCGDCGNCSGGKCPLASSSEINYYISKKTKLLNMHAEISRYIAQILKEDFDRNDINMIIFKSKEEFKKIIPEIPYIGGDENNMTEDLIIPAIYLSFYRELKKIGQSGEYMGKIILKSVEIRFNPYPLWLRKIVGNKLFSDKSIVQMKKNAIVSQERKYPGSWVTIIVQPYDGSFDIGWDNTECGIIKFFNQQDAPEIVRYFCMLDEVQAKGYDQLFFRSKTLANGDDRCDFRYKKK